MNSVQNSRPRRDIRIVKKKKKKDKIHRKIKKLKIFEKKQKL